MKPIMMQLIEISLVTGLIVSALALGGKEPISFSGVQILFLATAVLLSVAYARGSFGRHKLPFFVPVLLVAWVVLQIIPLPAAFLELLPRDSGQPSYVSHSTITVAPYETVSGLLALLTYVSAFYFTVIVCQRRQGMQRIVIALIALGTFEAFYGFIQYLTDWRQIPSYVKTYKIYYPEDVAGTYINRNHFAALLEMI
ncbi:MAG: hypothetical protein AAB037_05925, partial [Chloroflexota bacterium]